MSLKIDRDDARAWGYEAFHMGISLKDAISDISNAGCPKWLLADVEETYNRARLNAACEEH